jgi:hypothetical protein
MTDFPVSAFHWVGDTATAPLVYVATLSAKIFSAPYFGLCGSVTLSIVMPSVGDALKTRIGICVVTKALFERSIPGDCGPQPGIQTIIELVIQTTCQTTCRTTFVRFFITPNLS